jgi:proteic killer suppression protein
MIKNILHKGLKNFYLTGNSAGIHQAHQKRLRLILARLEAIHKPEDMNLPGFMFHKLSGKRKAEYAVTVNKNWRIIFKFDQVDAYDINYLDYH